MTGRGDRPSLVCYVCDELERATLAPIAEELAARGPYTVEFTRDFSIPSSLGLYACHGTILFDHGRGRWRELASTFSVMVGHDFDQDGDVGPQFFAFEGWGRFDLGLLPSRRLYQLAESAAIAGYAMPRHGMHAAGWAKSDRALRGDPDFLGDVERVRAELGLGERPVVLLACSWASRQQLDDLVGAIGDLDVDIVVRYPDSAPPTVQSPWFDALTDAYDELCAAVAMARARDRVITTGPEVDLYVLLALVDLVVSNGSNVLYESILMSTPGISVTSWAHRSGPSGQDWVEPSIAIGGVAVCTVSTLAQTVSSVLRSDVSEFVAVGRDQLIEPALRGRGAAAAADVIERALAGDDDVVRLRARLAECERSLADAMERLQRLER
jgi:hypothetical protein